ncbi:hypothetical protein O181_127151 [Austropuccinia psidii MF-1]|uniref:Uncharacterized protein n=1 Tax=Austropuccinia psidii MF-1 TaxID=1389203 RepID=A0A9Q3Q6J3_9BASI|nr:hypothetical protein [Austropuccinia psidii MF-1]
MVNTPGLCGKRTLFTNGKMIPEYLKWKILLKKPFLILIGTGPCPGFVKKHKLTNLHPDVFEEMPFSKEDYIDAIEDIATRKEIGRNWYKPPIDNKTDGKPTSRPNKPQDRAPLKCHKCGSTSHLANNFSKSTIINEIEIGKAEEKKETDDVSLHESDSETSEEEELPDQLSI